MKRYRLFLLFFGIFLSLIYSFSYVSVIAAPPSAVPVNTWMGSNLVTSIVGLGNKLYISGYEGFWGPRTRAAYPVSKLTGEPLVGYPRGFLPNVLKIIPDGNGGWFIAGELRVTGSVNYGLAHILSDGSLDTGFDPQTTSSNASVWDMKLQGGVLYVIGSFTSIGGQPRHNLAALNPVTGTATSWNPVQSMTGNIRSFEISGDTVYIGGVITLVNGEVRNNAAAFEISTETLLPWAPAMTGFSWDIKDIKVNGSVVYLGGGFTAINGTTRNKLAAVDATSGALLTWNPNLNGTVLDMYFDGPHLYVAFSGTTVGVTTRMGLARFDTAVADNPSLTAWDPAGSTYTAVVSLDSDGTDLYVGGYFNGTLGGQTRRYIAAINKNTALATSWNPRVATGIGAVSVSSSTVYLGTCCADLEVGGFLNTTGLVELDIPTGVATQVPIPGLPGGVMTEIDDMVIDGNTLYVAGNFFNATISGVSRSYLAALNMTTWDFTSWNPQPAARVRDLAIKGNYLYVGGDFNAMGGNFDLYNLARFNKTTGVADSSWVTNVDNDVNNIVPSDDGNTIYIGGWFDNVGAVIRHGIAAIDGTTGLATAWNPDANTGGIDTMVLSSSTLYVGGYFNTIGGASRNNIAGLDTTLNTNNATSFNPGANNEVTEMVLGGDGTLYVGGYFAELNGQTHVGVGAINTTSGLPESWNPALGYGGGWFTSTAMLPYSLYGYGGALFMGGDFNEFGHLESNLSGFDNYTLQQYFAQFGSFTAPSSETIEFTTSTSSGSESVTSPSISISLSGILGSNATVDYAVTGGTATGGGTDYTLATGTATVLAGNLSTTIPLTVINDLIVESDETLILTLSNPSNATLGSNTTFTYTIIDNDVVPGTPGVTITGAVVITEAGLTDTYTIELDTAPTNNVTITLAPDVQVTLSTTSLSFSSTTWNVPQTVIVTAVDDAIVEGNHTGTITHTATSADNDYDGISISSVTASITDNDTASTSSSSGGSSGSSSSGSVVPPPLPPILPAFVAPPIYTPPAPQAPGNTGTGGGNYQPPQKVSGNQGAPSPGDPNTDPLPEVPIVHVPDDTVILRVDGPPREGPSLLDEFVHFLSLFFDGAMSDLSSSIRNGFLILLLIIPYLVSKYGWLVINTFSKIHSFSDFMLTTTQFGNWLIGVLGFRKRRKLWGTVYDSVKKLPIDPALVELSDATTGKVVEEAITDLAGRYGFLVRPGTYILNAMKTNYSFPSKKSPNASDEIYTNLYHGEVITINAESDVVVPNIPMDPVAYDWNQASKTSRIKLHPRLKYTGQVFASVLFWAGFAWTVYVYTKYPSFINALLIFIYTLIFIITLLWPAKQLWGRLYSKINGQALGGLQLQLLAEGAMKIVLGRAMSAPDGKFFLKADPGKYTLQVTYKNGEESELLHERKVVIGKVGLYNKDVVV